MPGDAIPPQSQWSEVARAYGQLVPAAIRLCCDWFGLETVEFTPREGSPLRLKSQDGAFRQTVKLVADYSMCPNVLGNHGWQIEELDFANRVCTGSEPITLVDVGANMGLFSRQLLAALPTIVKAFAYEPEPRNFACLIHNLRPFRDGVVAVEAALSDKDGKMELYLNPKNAGNFSFNLSAMPQTYSTVSVESKDVTVESASWMDGGRRIFYKSDTEGFDEVVATSIRPEVWPLVFAGIVEIWPMKKPPFDKTVLAAIFDAFPNKILLANRNMNVSQMAVSTADLMNYIDGNGQHRDLGFWR